MQRKTLSSQKRINWTTLMEKSVDERDGNHILLHLSFV